MNEHHQAAVRRLHKTFNVTPKKRAALEAAGWRFGDAEDFLDDIIDLWHDEAPSGVPLRDYLGMTEEQYAAFAADGSLEAEYAVRLLVEANPSQHFFAVRDLPAQFPKIPPLDLVLAVHRLTDEGQPFRRAYRPVAGVGDLVSGFVRRQGQDAP